MAPYDEDRPIFMMRAVRICVTLLCALAAWLGPAAAALGHSVLERSDPAPNAALAAPPSRLVLRFSEPVDPLFTSVTAYDQAGRQVSGQTRVAADEQLVTVPLIDAARGVIAVRWRALSAADGHTSAGLFVFSVGNAPAGAGQTAQVLAPSFARLALRWVAYLAAIFLAGKVAFAAFVFEPGLRRADPAVAALLGAPASLALARATVWAAWVLGAAVMLDLVLQLAELTAGPATAARGVFAAFLFGTRPGWGAMVQAGMAGLLLIPRSPRGRILQAAAVVWIMLTVGLMTTLGGPAAVVGSTHAALLILASSVYGLLGVWMAFIVPQVRDIAVPPMPGVPVAAGAGLLVGIALRSHAAGNGLVALLADWLHLAAAALWIGGLASLWMVLRATPRRERGALARALAPRASRLAALGLAAAVATGAYATWQTVPAAGALVSTPYGRALLLKLSLVALIAALGAYNRFALLPTVAAAGAGREAATRRFGRAVAGEVALGAGVLLAVGALTIMPPARATYRPERAAPVIMSALAGDARVTITVTPLRQGGDRFEIAVAGDGSSVAADQRILLRLTRLDQDLEPATLTLRAQPGGYGTRDGYLLPDGWWDVTVIVRRRGREDVSATFPLRRGARRPPGADAEADRLLARARAAAAGLRSWREDEQAGDGRGGVVATRAEFQPPRRLRYHTSTGVEGVIIGAAHFVRRGGGAWARDDRAPPRSFDGAVASLAGARRAALGRRAACAREDCQVVLWDSPDGSTTFAGWIGISSGRLIRLLEIAQGRYRTVEISRFDAPIDIEAPRY
jgi:copper transport protein